MSSFSLFSTIFLLSYSLFLGASTAEPGVVGLQFSRRQSDPASIPSRRLGKRSGTAESTLDNRLIHYMINITVGTPPQTMEVELDTGSSDLWVTGANNPVCQQNKCPFGYFDPTASSTFVQEAADFLIVYGSGAKVTGDYFADTVTVAGVTVQNLTMGLGLTGSLDPTPYGYGLIGVSYDGQESLFQLSGGQTTYPDFMHQLVLQEKISVRAFSLWLNDIDSTGNVLFGGVDSAKYSGDLIVLPTQPNTLYTHEPTINAFWVTLVGVSAGPKNGGSTFFSRSTSVPALLDSGNANVFVPDEVALPIMAGVGAGYYSLGGNNVAMVPCSAAQLEGVISFQFGNSNGPIVAIPISEFVVPFANPLGADKGTPPSWDNGVEACLWKLLPASTVGGIISFGDPFIRGAYIVYNQDANTIAIAQSNLNATDSKIQQITDAQIIPGATSTASGNPETSRLSYSTVPVASTPGSAPPTPTFSFATASPTNSKAASSTPSNGVASIGLVAPSISLIGAFVGGVVALLGLMAGPLLML